MSDLLGNPEDLFSRVTAHMILPYSDIYSVVVVALMGKNMH